MRHIGAGEGGGEKDEGLNMKMYMKGGHSGEGGTWKKKRGGSVFLTFSGVKR